MFFWEIVIIYRKVAIICVLVFMINYSKLIQALSAFAILMATVYFQYDFKPYVENHLNFLEIEAIFIATITIYCGLYYLTNQIGNYFQVFLFCIILIGNFYFFLNWIFYMSKACGDVFLRFVRSRKHFHSNKDSYPKYYSASSLLKQGSYLDQDGNIQYTLIKKQQIKNEEFSFPGVNSNIDLFKHCLKEIPELKEIQELEEIPELKEIQELEEIPESEKSENL